MSIAEPKKESLAVSMSLHSEGQRNKLLAELTDQQAHDLEYEWSFWARPNQLPPETDWRIWLLLAGRGFGKSRAGAEWVRKIAEDNPGCRIALVGPTAADVRDVMVEGESGLLAISPEWFTPEYMPSKRRVMWPNGSMATTFSADEPERLRGPQHHFMWADEIAAWRYPAAWDMAMLGLRLGNKPQTVVTTTPKPLKIIKDLMTRAEVTRGTTYDNADNLAPAYMEEIIDQYEGTRLGRQELYAEILDDNPNALWKREQIDSDRVSEYPQLKRIVVGVDPAISDKETSSETGIVCVGKSTEGHYYVLDDASIRASPHGWGSAAVASYNKNKADRVVGEGNQGGDMVGHTITTIDPKVAFKKVHASRGKHTRAEPVSALYEQGKVHHVGSFPQLEDQMCEWEPGMTSPDRMDALVWAISELMEVKTSSVSLGGNTAFQRASPNKI